jgi:hypothetical protein
MPHWTETARRQHVAASRALVDQVNRMAISVPIGDSDYTAPGYLYLGHLYTCVPDPRYPWDMDVLRALRSLQPDCMPILIKSVWRYSNYNDHGRLGEPMVLVRHGLARSIRDPIMEMHHFQCEMPATAIDGLAIPGRSLAESVPNYLEHEHYSRDVRPWGYDMPGAYLPFDWAFFRQMELFYANGVYIRRASQEKRNAKGDRQAKGAASAYIEQKRDDLARRKRQRKEEGAYVHRDLSRSFYEPSELEVRDAHLGGGPRKSAPVSIAVPNVP